MQLQFHLAPTVLPQSVIQGAENCMVGYGSDLILFKLEDPEYFEYLPKRPKEARELFFSSSLFLSFVETLIHFIQWEFEAQDGLWRY